MIINRMTEGESGRVGDADMEILEDNSNEYRTADEIYQIMAKSDSFEGDGDKALSARDLVILYKNIDLGTKVVPKASQETSRSPNQYVETVIYNDDRGSEGSDISEDISSEDLNYVFAINKERIDILNNFGDTLCHKFGDIQMHTSELTTEYDRHFLFNDSCVKEQLKSFHKLTNSKQSDSTVLPASLLDYICSKRLEDNNYNHFYMDSIIKYVQNTIEQLKRISNGDYLTGKVKVKWNEVDGVHSPTNLEACNKIILSCSASIPLHVADKRNKTITWDDIVHSEMDIRSISKILEKKVIVEVPKIICGTYRLFSKRCQDNLIITCKKDKKPEKEQIDVVLKLQRSKSGHVVSNIESIMILKSLPILAPTEKTSFNYLLPLEFMDEENVEKYDKNVEFKVNTENIPQIVTDVNTKDCSLAENRERDIENFIEDDYEFSSECLDDNNLLSQPCCYKSNECSTSRVDFLEENECSRSVIDYSEDNGCSSSITDDLNAKERGIRQTDCNEDDECGSCRAEANFDITATGDLHSIIHRLSMRSPVIEESEENMKKKKSPTRVRIKSPYENKSHVLEEKKRKKLLEIRQKREMKKNSMSESFKITKNRHGRTPIMVQASNSVTKLSITNKYFYNSIYGQSRKYVSSKNFCKYPKDRVRDSVPRIELVEEGNHDSSPLRATPEKDNQKFINRSYYLDDADTEIKYLQTKQNEIQDVSRDDMSTSTANNEIDVKLIKKLIDPSVSTTRLQDFSSTDTSCGLPLNVSCDGSFADIENKNIEKDDITSKQNSRAAFITKPLETEVSSDYNNGKTMSSLECRKNIDKIYGLIKKISETDTVEVRTSESKIRNHIDIDLNCSKTRSCEQARDSRTHIQQQITDCNISRFLEKSNVLKIKTNPKMKFEKSPPFISKVTINPKSNPIKLNYSKIQENPLKALSQLIHKIDNVQKANNRINNEIKGNKGIENFKRIPKQDHYLKDTDKILPKDSTAKERRRQSTGYGPTKIEHQQLQSEETSLGKSKKIADLIDEVKELRGEAVRGPSKKLIRLNSLAQPKKPYLPAAHQETLNRFGKRAPDRLIKQPLPILNPEKKQPSSNPVAFTSLRGKQRKVAEGLPTSAKQSHAVGMPSDRSSRTKPSTQRSLSPDENARYSSLSSVRSPCTRGSVKKTPEQRNGKMSVAGPHVKNPYGRNSQLLEHGDTSNVQKSKVPSVPQDFHDLGSLNLSPEESINSAIEKSTILGKKLHHMIDNVINSDVPVLQALAKCKESISSLNDIFEGSSNDARLKYDEVTISESDHPIDIFKDKHIVTAVSSIKRNTKEDEMINDNKPNTNVSKINKLCTPDEILKLDNIPQNTSNREIQNNSEINRMALDTIHKQLLENEKFLQHGYEYTQSLVLKSSMSSAKTDPPDHRIDLGFTKFPMQISTVGYALPYFIKRNSLTTIRYLENKNSKSDFVKPKPKINPEIIPTISKSIQCFKGANRAPPQGTIENIIKNVVCPLPNSNENENLKILNNCECAMRVDNHEQNTIESETIEDVGQLDSQNSNINNTTSLDILVDLLNEIKKITLFQVDIHNQEKANFDFNDKEVEVILNNLADKESSIEQNANSLMSLTSLDKLQIIESRTNISYSTPNTQANKDKTVTEKNETTSTCVVYEPLCVDKEVNAKILSSEFIHKYTEVPSRFFPVTVSTNITDSFIKLINYTPTRSLHSFADCERIKTSISNKIIAIPSKVAHKSVDSGSIDTVISPAPTLGIQYLNDNITFIGPKKIAIEQNHSIVEHNDPLMKMKRDILVTVYSILVFTVFAALSFPESVYRL